MPRMFMVQRNEYHDSIELMLASEQIRHVAGVTLAMVAMGTENNRKILRDLGFIEAEEQEPTINDMMLAIKAESKQAIDHAVQRMKEFFLQRSSLSRDQAVYPSFESALNDLPEANLCIISIPGEYAAAEARKALSAGLHVLVFSDNVPLNEEKEIKELAKQKGLLCMGPDCGVANINSIALATASVVRKGPIGIAGASGSGIQQITVLIEREGLGVSQAIGVGGRDLRDEIGGLSMLAAIDTLTEDEETQVIVLVSRTPGRQTLAKITKRIQGCKKRIVVCFLGCEPNVIRKAGAIPADNLEDAAFKAIDLVLGKPLRSEKFSLPEGLIQETMRKEIEHMGPKQKYLRGLFCGGTFCEEAMMVLKKTLGHVYSNAPLSPDFMLKDPLKSIQHTIVDMGDEQFTLGRPHPVIDPAPRCQRIFLEGTNPEVAVLLLDFILGHAVHPDPVGAVVDTIVEVKAERRKMGEYLSVVATVCGTEGDPQNLTAQENKLRQAGAVVMPSNAQAARIAGMIIEKKNE